MQLFRRLEAPIEACLWEGKNLEEANKIKTNLERNTNIGYSVSINQDRSLIILSKGREVCIPVDCVLIRDTVSSDISFMTEKTFLLKYIEI